MRYRRAGELGIQRRVHLRRRQVDDGEACDHRNVRSFDELAWLVAPRATCTQGQKNGAMWKIKSARLDSAFMSSAKTPARSKLWPRPATASLPTVPKGSMMKARSLLPAPDPSVSV
ncbi:MAG: hypothetical protein ACRDTV_25165 [Mycobacterium sp.]